VEHGSISKDAQVAFSVTPIAAFEEHPRLATIAKLCQYWSRIIGTSGSEHDRSAAGSEKRTAIVQKSTYRFQERERDF
jgi:hypothetical protein